MADEAIVGGVYSRESLSELVDLLNEVLSSGNNRRVVSVTFDPVGAKWIGLIAREVA